MKDLSSLENLFKENGAIVIEDLEQTDTYFCVQKGRLKLRETADKKSELIFYERDEESSASMQSIYDVLPLTDLSLKNFLVKSLGIKTVVEKDRRLLKLENARIHLDRAKSLGQFLEFEVVAEGNDTGDAELLDKLKRLAQTFIVEEINVSYSDLVVSSNS